jgi:alkylation response protein AidB-like acyl-CoA dehydrogenase
VAAAKTTAVRDGAEWIINGQKMFTSTAQVCSHVFVLARTNPDAPKHKGLSLFLVPTDARGYEIQPIHTLGGQVTNATFYTDVRVPDAARIGGIDEGWNVMKVALVYERGVAGPTSLDKTVSQDLASWARQTHRTDGTAVLDDPLAAERIGRIAVDEEVSRLLGHWVNWQVAKGGLPGVEGSMRKLFLTEALQRHYSDALDILGAEGLLAPGSARRSRRRHVRRRLPRGRGHHGLRRDERDPPGHHRRTRPRPAPPPARSLTAPRWSHAMRAGAFPARDFWPVMAFSGR